MNREKTNPEAAAALEKLRYSVAQVVGPETARAGLEPGNLVGASLDRALARLNCQEAARQATIEQIIRLAGEEMTAADEETLADRSWLAQFFRHAQDAGHEEEQQVWARILAREISIPGSFGKRTLALLGTMEAWELLGFIEYAAFAFSFESGSRFVFDTESARREIWTYGREGDLMQHFINIGLLAGELGHISPASARGLRICYRDRVFELRDAPVSEPPPVPGEIGVAYRRFTVCGQQLFAAIRPKSFFGYAGNVVEALRADCGIHFERLDVPAQ